MTICKQSKKVYDRLKDVYKTKGPEALGDEIASLVEHSADSLEKCLTDFDEFLGRQEERFAEWFERPYNDDILTFQEFTSLNPDPRYDSMHFMFMDINYGGRRDSDYFKKLEKEEPELEARLTLGVSEVMQNVLHGKGHIFDLMKPHERDLHAAYRIMRGYGATDTQLFR